MGEFCSFNNVLFLWGLKMEREMFESSAVSFSPPLDYKVLLSAHDGIQRLLSVTFMPGDAGLCLQHPSVLQMLSYVCHQNPPFSFLALHIIHLSFCLTLFPIFNDRCESGSVITCTLFDEVEEAEGSSGAEVENLIEISQLSVCIAWLATISFLHAKVVDS